MQFNFHGSRTPDILKKDMIDAMVEASNGRPLPGRWGLIQTLCNVWTTAPPHASASLTQKLLWTTKASLSSVGVWKAYLDSKKTVSQMKPDPFVEFCMNENLVRPSPIQHMADLILNASKNRVPYEDIALRDENSYIVRKFMPIGSPPYFFKLYISTDGSGHHISDGPLFVNGTEDAGLTAIRDVLWTQFQSHVLRLTVYENPVYSLNHYSYDLADAGTPEPYISDESSDDWTNAKVYAQRCHAFMSQSRVRGVLFYGPPGTGKTSLAMHVLGDAGRVLKITSEAINHSTFAPITELIQVIDPRVILFDDIDRFDREGLSAMLEYMEGLKKSPPKAGRIIVGTVNAIETLDPALLRAGRFDEVLAVPEPKIEQRRAIIAHYIRFFNRFAATLDPIELADQMDGFSPADIRSIIESVSCVGVDCLDAEIERIKRQRALFAGDKVLQYLNGPSSNNP